MRNSRLGLALALVACIALSTLRAQEITLVDQLREQIKTTETLLEQSTRNNEKAQLQKQLDRLRRELENQEERLRLLQKEKELERTLAATPEGALRDMIRRNDLSTDHLEKEIAAKESAIRELEGQRDSLVEQRAAVRPDNDKLAVAAADLEERIFAARDAIGALQVERDSLKRELEFAQQIDRVETRLKEAQTLKRPTLAAVVSLRTDVLQRDHDIGAEAALRGNHEASREVARATLELARQKLAQIDEEIALKEKQTGLFNSNAQVARLLSIARSQKKYLDQRLTSAERTVAAWDRMIRADERLTDLMSHEATWLQIASDKMQDAYVRRLAIPAAIIVGLCILYLLISRLVLPAVQHRENLLLTRRFGRYLLLLASVIVIGAFLFEDLRLFATTLGIVSAAIVIALQDVCAAMAGWVVIITGGKFRIGDRVEIDGTHGDVLDIELLRTTMLEVGQRLSTDDKSRAGQGVDHPTGRVIVLPNSFVLKTKVFNSSHGHPYIWRSEVFTFTYESPWREAEEVLRQVFTDETSTAFDEARRAAAAMEKRYGMSDAEYQPKILMKLADSGFEFTCLHVCHFRNVDQARSRIHHGLARHLLDHPRLALAYPTQREFGVHENEVLPFGGISRPGSVTAPAAPTPIPPITIAERPIARRQPSASEN
jgi:small-conductance mechanosensitive channel